jgi:O-antigen ligase
LVELLQEGSVVQPSFGETTDPIRSRHGARAGIAPPSAGARARRRGLRAPNDLFRQLLYALVVIDISRIHQQFPMLKVLRPALLLTIATVAVAYAHPALLSKRGLLLTWPARLVAMFGLLACISAPFGISLGSSGVFILNDYAKTIVLVFLIIIAMRGTRDFYGLVWAVVGATGLLVFTSLFIFKVTQYQGYARLANLDTYDANDLGLVLLVGLAFTLLAFQGSGRIGRPVCTVVLLGIGAAISKSGSRGALIGFGAAGLAMLFLLDRIPVVRRVAFLGATVLALTVFAPPGYWMQMSTIFNPTADYNWASLNGRREVAKRGMAYFEMYPIFGLGIHNFAKAECTISDKAHVHVEGTGIRCTPPHNAYIEAMSELGIGGILLWLLMIPGGVLGVLRLRRLVPKAWETGTPEQRFLAVAPQYLAVGFTGFAVGSFFLSFAWMDVTYILPASWASLEIAIRTASQQTQLARGDRTQRVNGSMLAPSQQAERRRA